MERKLKLKGPNALRGGVIKRFVAYVTAVLVACVGLVGVTSAGPASATGNGGGECTFAWERDIPQSHVERKFKKVVKDYKTQWYFTKYTHTKTKPKHGQWSDYGPWTQWTPITHESWEDNNVPALGSPAYHGSGTYSDGTQWYREWQARNTGQTRQVQTGSHYVYYLTGGGSSTTNTDANWTTDTPGSPWVQFDQRTVQDPPIHQGPVRSATEPDRGEYPNVPWTKIPGSEECPPDVIALPAAQTYNDPCNGPGVTNNVAWDNPLPASTEDVIWTESADHSTRTAALARDNSVWEDNTTADKVYVLPPDNGVTCPVPPTPNPTKVTGMVKVVDKCGTANDKVKAFVRYAVGYSKNGHFFKAGVWRKAHNGDIITAKATKPGTVYSGQAKWVVKTTNAPCQPPGTGERNKGEDNRLVGPFSGLLTKLR